MIVNCGAMGVDWERMSLGAYAEALEAYNSEPSNADGGEPKIGADFDRLSRFHRAHSRQ